jgi:hypothetical protein
MSVALNELDEELSAAIIAEKLDGNITKNESNVNEFGGNSSSSSPVIIKNARGIKITKYLEALQNTDGFMSSSTAFSDDVTNEVLGIENAYIVSSALQVKCGRFLQVGGPILTVYILTEKKL